MELRHEFTVPVPVEEAWRALLDIERVAPCMPGATVESFDGETIEGSVKVKVGPMTVTYRGTAAFQERDASAHRMVLSARGKELRGQGTARATVTGVLGEGADAGSTEVTVSTDLAITGRPAQFGRGVMAEVGDKIIGQFADCLAGKLAGTGAAGAAAPPAATAAAGTAAAGEGHPDGPGGPDRGSSTGGPSAGPDVREPAPARSSTAPAEPIDLLRTAGAPVAKRAAAAGLAAVAVGAALFSLLRRRHRARPLNLVVPRSRGRRR